MIQKPLIQTACCQQIQIFSKAVFEIAVERAQSEHTAKVSLVDAQIDITVFCGLASCVRAKQINTLHAVPRGNRCNDRAQITDRINLIPHKQEPPSTNSRISMVRVYTKLLMVTSYRNAHLSKGNPYRTRRCRSRRRLFFMLPKKFLKTDCSKRDFLSDQIGGLFKTANDAFSSEHFVNFCEKGSKKCVLAAYHMRGLFRRDANRQRRRGNVNDL